MIEQEPPKNAFLDTDFLTKVVGDWESSEERKNMEKAREYYLGKHNILNEGRKVKDPMAAQSLPNHRIVDNKYCWLVDQKVNYLLGKPIVFKTEDELYAEQLEEIFNKRFLRTFRRIGADSLNCCVGWVYPYIGKDGSLKFRKFDPVEIIPFWENSEQTDLECVVRVFETVKNTDKTKKKEKFVEVYLPEACTTFKSESGLIHLKTESYVTETSGNDTKPLNWGKIPIVPFKYNPDGITLLSRVNSLQDAINTMRSVFINHMEEDAWNTVLILKNYDGEDLEELRGRLIRTGIVKVRTIDGEDGGIDSLEITVNAENFEIVFRELNAAFVENGRGYDAKRMNSGTDPNEMNLKSMYIDIDLDADMIESEYQASFEELLYFVNMYLQSETGADYTKEKVDVIFNRDTIVNSNEIIQNLIALGVRLPNETLVNEIPFIDKPKDVLALLDKQDAEELKRFDNYSGGFPPASPPGKDDDDEE